MSDQRMPPVQVDNSVSNDFNPADELRALLERAELSQRGAAKLLGVDERTMRMWCAGQGIAPASVYRALDPRLTYSEHLRLKIEQNEQLIELHETGRSHELPREYRPVDAEATKREVGHLRGRNEKYSSILRWQDSIDRLRDAQSVVFQHWLTFGAFGLPLENLQEFDDARQEFQSAMADVDRIAEMIRASHILGAFQGKPTPPSA
jgi:hypothetical protein